MFTLNVSLNCKPTLIRERSFSPGKSIHIFVKIRIFLEKHTGENPETYARMKQKDEYPEITHRNPTAGIYGKQYSYHLPIKQTAPV